MMHCGGRPSTRCLSGKKLRPSGHSGRRCLVASSITTAPCGAVPPLFSSLLPSTPSNLEVRSHKQQAEVRKKELPELENLIMLQLTFSPRYQLEPSYRFAGSALPLIASMSPSTTGKECRDHRREPDVVRSRTKSTGIDYQLRETSCSGTLCARADVCCVYVQAVRLMRAGVACMYIAYMHTSDKGSYGPCGV